VLSERALRSNSIAKLTPEWALLIEIARPNQDPGRLSELATGVANWPNFLLLAEQHGLLPLFLRKLKDLPENLIPPEICLELRGKNRAHTLFALSLSAELFRVLDRFAAANIEIAVIKGPVLSMRCYGDPALRQYTDIDLIVRTRDVQRSTEMMLELGYQPRVSLQAITNRKIPGEYVFRRPATSLLVEFHTEHTFRYHPRRLPVEKVFARRTRVDMDHRQVPALSVEDELVLICIHAAKHMWERLGWVADVAALLRNSPDLKWERAVSAAEEVGAQRMLRVATLLAAKLLELPISAEMTEYAESDAAAARLASKIAARLPQGNPIGAGVLRRAAFRVKMRVGLLSGLVYLLRLSLSPTEDDWALESEPDRPWVFDALSRPLRLARKYYRGAGE
jgi:Uncharacterised nucleotidyltransferase